MTVVNTETGVITDLPSREDAQRRTAEARTEFASAAAHHARGWEIVHEAITSGDHMTLGYASAGAYIKAEYDGVLDGLDVTSRRLAARELEVLGISTRDAAAVLGVSNYTVSKDRNAGVSDLTPDQTPEPAEGGEAETGSGQTADAEDDDPSWSESDEAPVVAQSEGEVGSPAVPRPPITGHDGKVYKFEKPKKAKKKPAAIPRPEAEKSLNAIAHNAALAATAAKNLTADQIRRIRPKADLWTVGLRESIETLQRLADSLDNQGEPK